VPFKYQFRNSLRQRMRKDWKRKQMDRHTNPRLNLILFQAVSMTKEKSKSRVCKKMLIVV
jgi:hypothetical protein